MKIRVLDHRGVRFWTEFEPFRSIPLHKYSPIDRFNRMNLQI